MKEIRCETYRDGEYYCHLCDKHLPAGVDSSAVSHVLIGESWLYCEDCYDFRLNENGEEIEGDGQ